MPDTVIRNVGDCGYWMYLGNSGGIPKASGSMKPIDPAQLDYGHKPLPSASYTQSHSTPRVLTRAEKGQALTHLEMDFNLASLFHKLNTSSVAQPSGSASTTYSFSPEEFSSTKDVYFESHKPTRAQEMAGLFATFSYAPIVDGSGSIIQNPFQTIKIQHTTDEIRYKLSNERIPGTLDIAEDFRVTGSTFIRQDCRVNGNVSSSYLDVTKAANIAELRTSGTASFDGDVYIKGNLYVNGVFFGNLSQPEYNSPNYAQQYVRWGVQDTSSVITGGEQSDIRLKYNLSPLTESLKIVDSIEPKRFTWAPSAEKSGRDVGVVAQDVKEVYPEAVSEGSDGYLRVNYEKLIPVLLGAIRELKEEVECLKKQQAS